MLTYWCKQSLGKLSAIELVMSPPKDKIDFPICEMTTKIVHGDSNDNSHTTINSIQCVQYD